MAASLRGHTNWRWVGSLALGIGVSLFFLHLTLRKVEWHEVGEAVAHVSIPVLALALLTRGFSFLAMGLRSRATVAPGGSVDYRDLVLSHLLGYTGNNILPFRLGELLRAEYLARRHELPRSFLFGTIAVERLLDSAALLAMFALSVPVVIGQRAVSGTYFLLLAATGGLLVLVMFTAKANRIPEVLGRALQPLSPRLAEEVRKHTLNLGLGFSSLVNVRLARRAIGPTVLYWLSSAGSVAVIIAAFGLHLPRYAPFVVLAVTALGTALPAAPGFLGTFHYFSALGLSLMGADPPTSISFAIVAHAMAIVPYTLIGLIVFSGSIPFWIRRAMIVEAERKGETPGA